MGIRESEICYDEDFFADSIVVFGAEKKREKFSHSIKLLKKFRP